MNRSDRKTSALAVDDAANSLIPGSTGVGTAIARIEGGQALSPAKLEEHRLIHRNDSVRVHADSFRELRTRLLALGNERSFVTLVVPVAHGCGGSFVARNLAAAFAFDESKTAMLIDCDARHPSQHKIFDINGERPGLMDYLDDTDFDLDKILHGSGIPRLYLIPAGRRSEATAESFASARMRTMVDSLRSQNDDRYLILDGPAAQGTPDARILSELADFVVLVAGYGKVTMEQIDRAAASFAPEKLAGIVFNNGP